MLSGDAHHATHGEWPTPRSTSIPENRFDTWSSIENALRFGLRGLSKRSSLARLLAEHRDRRNRKGLPPFCVAQILDWADRRHRDFGTWPGTDSGPIPDAPGETWNAVDSTSALTATPAPCEFQFYPCPHTAHPR